MGGKVVEASQMRDIKGWQVIQVIGILLAIGACLGLVGCAIAPSRTKIVWHDGKKIVIDAQDKSAVTVKLDGDEVTVDNRSPSMFRDLIQMMLLKEMREPVVNK